MTVVPRFRSFVVEVLSKDDEWMVELSRIDDKWMVVVTDLCPTTSGPTYPQESFGLMEECSRERALLVGQACKERLLTRRKERA